MAFIEASLEELPVSANLGQSCLATKISAPGPSSFGWFRHNYLTNNVLESLNAQVKKLKGLLLHELVNKPRELIMEKRYLRKKLI